MKLIAGLGNPGKKYFNNRHNIGFRVIDEIARRNDVSLRRKLFSCANEGSFYIGREKVVLIQPLTFMNMSGGCVRKYLDKYKILANNMLIVYDDINFPLSQIRLKAKGSSAGHNGVESIIKVLRSDDFNRLRVGISNETDFKDLSSFVLSDFKSNESQKLKEAIQLSADACKCWIIEGIEKAMSRYN